MAFADHYHSQVPVRQALGEQPLSDTRAKFDGANESFAGGFCLVSRRPTKSVNPFGGRIRAETSGQLLTERVRASGRSDTRVVSAPSCDSPSLRGACKVKVRKIEYYSAGRKTGDEGTDL